MKIKKIYQGKGLCGTNTVSNAGESEMGTRKKNIPVEKDALAERLVIPMSKKTLKRLKARAEELEVKPTVLTRAIILEFLRIKNFFKGE